MAIGAVGLSLVLVLSLVAPAHAQGPPISTTNAAFQRSLDRIAQGSPLWREALAAVHAGGRRVIVVTPDEVRVVEATTSDGDRFDDTLLAEVAPIVHTGTRVAAVVVVVNIALLEEQHRVRRLLPVEFDMDLDRILIHEIYGHAIPYLLAGDLSGRCPDPQPGERAVDACSIKRENAVRAELGLGRRVDYGLHGLSLSRGQ